MPLKSQIACVEGVYHHVNDATHGATPEDERAGDLQSWYGYLLYSCPDALEALESDVSKPLG
jgi:hypothetical protein